METSSIRNYRSGLGPIRAEVSLPEFLLHQDVADSVVENPALGQFPALPAWAARFPRAALSRAGSVEKVLTDFR